MSNNRLWLARALIGLVLFFNLQCALLFLWRPEDYVAGFGLSGAAGMGMLRALGLLFVMWNVPYVFACVHPIKYRISLIEAVIMQAIGLVGETIILISGNYQDALIQVTMKRFILFDGMGLAMLLLVFELSRSGEMQKD
jgi:hypothetical protein